ncbi:hypothetical protein Tsubulata_014667 [Turnera subulata]|uniref:Endonuclease/exonuclease/phosphatase domain-containing protein n=1 Tax=Turnera subulata TaxID=218843 RepID=A0A9Q0EZ67_9ROSI|nr:hypothetical protein Tsubulata_014667 [Turnera subulata]
MTEAVSTSLPMECEDETSDMQEDVSMIPTDEAATGAIYASPQEKWRRFLWDNLTDLAPSINEPWLLGGDFNAVLAGQERLNRWRRPGKANAKFQQCVFDSGLLDMGYTGQQFTWKSGGRTACLDRFLCNNRWFDRFPESTVFILPRTCSDHSPVVCRHNPLERPHRNSSCFQIQTAWLSHPEFEQMVKKT